MYQLIYIPRIQDEIILAQTIKLDDIKNLMTQLKIRRPKAYPHHYIWDTVNKIKIEH